MMPTDESGDKWAWYVSWSLGACTCAATVLHLIPLHNKRFTWSRSLPSRESLTDSLHSSEPCIRGHRSTRCEHYDRFMLRVKKPGRPLSSCPHPKNQCTCGKERVMMVRIPKGGFRISMWSSHALGLTSSIIRLLDY